MTDTSPQTPGILFIFSGPSGVGKDTVLRRALPRLGAIRHSISVTTRSPRPGEVDGEDYLFVDQQTFARMVEEGALLEHAAVHGNFYGTPRGWVMEQLQAGTDVVLEIDVQGALQVKTLFPQAILVFLAPPSWRELERRLRRRNTDDAATIHRRLQNARREMAKVDNYDYLVVNDHLPTAVKRFSAIVLAERCRPWRQQIAVLLREGENHG